MKVHLSPIAKTMAMRLARAELRDQLQQRLTAVRQEREAFHATAQQQMAAYNGVVGELERQIADLSTRIDPPKE